MMKKEYIGGGLFENRNGTYLTYKKSVPKSLISNYVSHIYKE